MADHPGTFLDRHPTPLLGKAFELSALEEGEIKKVHTDSANNVTLTADVATIHNRGLLSRVPFLFPYASSDARAGIFSVPQVGDKCLVAFASGNIAYVVGYHPTVRSIPARASAVSGGPTVVGTFGQTQLVPGATEIRSPSGNRIMVHPGGSIAIDAKVDLFSFYDAVKATVVHMARSHRIFSAGGSVLWQEGEEKSKRSMSLTAQFFTKAATQENLDAGATRGGARMTVQFSEKADHFLLDVTDQNNISSKIAIGPNGIILTSAQGANQTSITISPGGNWSLLAGDPNGLHTEINLASTAVAMSAKNGTTDLATVLSETNGKVTVTAQSEVVIDAPRAVTTQELRVARGGIGLARGKYIDKVRVFGVDSGSSTAQGFVTSGSDFAKGI